jgi:hypothetical protein
LHPCMHLVPPAIPLLSEFFHFFIY